MLQVCVFIQGRQLPSSRVRALNLAGELHSREIATTFIEYPRSTRQRFNAYLCSRNHDVVVIQKLLFSWFDILLLRILAKRIVFDFDDAIYYRQDRQKENSARFRKFTRMVQKADLIIAGNRVLAKQAEQYNKSVVIIPSAVETRQVATKDYSSQASDSTIIGWVGTEMNLAYLALLEPVLQKLAAEYSIVLRIICNKPITLTGVEVQFIPWQLETQEAEIAQFDIGVMPLPDSEHAAGKCGYKALQYMAAAVPAVASDVGVNSEIITDGEDGLIAAHIDDFYQKLKYLIEHPEQRQRIGLAGRRRVEGDFSIEVVGKQLADSLKALATGQSL